ncbi:hypothetical protein EP47_07640 [Legionella norrlandica]|uniref:Uncharacterized protein n=1 Tax=Legionella norrlandica TaxID=1498499 RepID=A0A0A2SUJ4_9GAMM|nr:hypothetical protein [Legionella norrlandica]KGP63124.1 hypothetical protein EP47_07640 [Legionella norrlandica]
MSYTQDEHQRLLEQAKKQKEALDQRDELYNQFMTDRMKYSKALIYKTYNQPLNELGCDLDDNQFFLYLKSDSNKSNPIKLHIPLQDGIGNGLLIANIIHDMNIGIVNAMKVINPNIDQQKGTEESIQRAKTGAAITIYFQSSASPEQMAQAIYQINKKLGEVKRTLYPFNSGETADSDLKMGEFVGITIDTDNNGKYLSASDPDELNKRRELLENSKDIKRINEVLPRCKTLERIDLYISNREKQGTYTTGYASFFNSVSCGLINPFTKKQKIAAATALKEVILGNQPSSSLEKHLDALEQGSLKEVFKAAKQNLPNFDEIELKAANNSLC